MVRGDRGGEGREGLENTRCPHLATYEYPLVCDAGWRGGRETTLTSSQRLRKMPQHPPATDGSSALQPHQAVQELVYKGLKRRPGRGETVFSFVQSITHLHLDGLGLVGHVEPLKLCASLQVLYLYDNRLTSLRGIASLKKLTHLYAQNNELENLHDFEAPPALQQLFLNGNCLAEVRGLHEAACLVELHLAGQRRRLASPPPPAEWALGAPPPLEKEVEKEVVPVHFEQSSLFAVAPTLRKLDVSCCHLNDDAIATFVVFQELEVLELQRNQLESVRLPLLTCMRHEPPHSLADGAGGGTAAAGLSAAAAQHS